MDDIRAVWVGGSSGARHTVDIIDTFETAVESLKAAKNYVNRSGRQKFERAEFLEGPARQTGTRLGVPVAVGFEVYGLGG